MATSHTLYAYLHVPGKVLASVVACKMPQENIRDVAAGA